MTPMSSGRVEPIWVLPWRLVLFLSRLASEADGEGAGAVG